MNRLSKPGIYQIKNILSDQRYIGSAVDIAHRWSAHKYELVNNRHHNAHLQAAWNKYGENAFELTVLLFCEKSELLRYEQYFIDSIHPEYNIAKIAGNLLGTKRTEETKRKIGISNKGKIRTLEARQQMSRSHLGVPMSEQTRSRMSKAQKGRVMSEETRKKLSAAHKGLKAGKPLSEEHKQKIRESHLKSDAVKNAIKKAQQVNTGKHRSSEIIEKIRLSNAGKKRSKEICDAMSLRLLGRKLPPHTEEHKNKIRESVKKNWELRKQRAQLSEIGLSQS